MNKQYEYAKGSMITVRIELDKILDEVKGKDITREDHEARTLIEDIVDKLTDAADILDEMEELEKRKKAAHPKRINR